MFEDVPPDDSKAILYLIVPSVIFALALAFLVYYIP